MQTVFFKNMPKILSGGSIAGPKECAGVVGKVVDYGITDVNNMGAAMAPDIGIIGI